MLVDNQFTRKFQLVIVGEGRGTHNAVIAFGSVGGRGSKHIALLDLPLPVQIFVAALAFIKLLHPSWQILAVIRRGDPGSAILVDPIGAVGREPARKNGGTVLQ